MASRSLDDLLPDVAATFRKWLDLCKQDGVDILVYCSYRSPEEQDATYAKGRTSPGDILTNARGWMSWHNYRRAVDAIPIVNGKCVWSYRSYDPNWRTMRRHADELGIEWGGAWMTFKDFDHWQITDGLSLEAARAALNKPTDTANA